MNKLPPFSFEIVRDPALELRKVSGNDTDIKTFQDCFPGFAIQKELKRCFDEATFRKHLFGQPFIICIFFYDPVPGRPVRFTDFDIKFEWIFVADLPYMNHCSTPNLDFCASPLDHGKEG
jgi:hypothetical protein